MTLPNIFRAQVLSPSRVVSVSRLLPREVLGVAAFIAMLHLVGWGSLALVLWPGDLSLGSKAFGVGTGLTAYMLGVRHAFDADHIAAIDNTTRKLLRQGRRPHTVGFWFSCGHSSIVFGLTLLIAFGVHSVAGSVLDENSLLHYLTGTAGTVISATFLYLVAAMNMIVLYEVWSVFRQARFGICDESAIDAKLSRRGLVNRLLNRVMSVVSKPWQMFVVGTLFGLGFDTATEVSLLVLTATGAASGIPWYAVLCLPVLFAAGMSLMDTLDSSLMNSVYGWALNDPLKKLYYNLVVTALSVVAAVLIATVEFLGLMTEHLGLQGGLWDSVAAFDMNVVGFALAGLFMLTWMVALWSWKVDAPETTEGLRLRVVHSDGNCD